MKRPQKNWLEWTVFVFSLVLLLSIVGLLLFEAFSFGDKPANPQMRLGAAEKHDGYFAVPVSVENQGDATAENVHLAVELQVPGREKERGEFDLPYLPRRATRQAWVTFRQDPGKGKLEALVLGYEKP
ncbi:MAG: hypothetical protein ACR2G0_02885 [Chthoniobacterales bacterium]